MRRNSNFYDCSYSTFDTEGKTTPKNSNPSLSSAFFSYYFNFRSTWNLHEISNTKGENMLKIVVSVSEDSNILQMGHPNMTSRKFFDLPLSCFYVVLLSPGNLCIHFFATQMKKSNPKVMKT